MALEVITDISLSWRIIISIYLFKRASDDLGGKPSRIKILLMIQSIYSLFIIASCILREMLWFY